MKLRVINKSRYMTEQVTRLIRCGIRGSQRTRRAYSLPVVFDVQQGRSHHAHVVLIGTRSARLYLPLPISEVHAGKAYAHLVGNLHPDEAARAIRGVRWAALILSGLKNSDLTQDQKTINDDLPSWASKNEMCVRERVGKDTRSPDARLAAHDKKIKHAQQMLVKAARRTKLAHTLQTKWQKKLNALKAVSSRVGMPAGKKRKPKPITQAELDKLDQAFID